MIPKARQVVDANGIKYALAKQLGRGGQGAVYEVSGGRLAVKLLFDASPTRREHLRNQLSSVRRLPLQGLDIASPLEMLRPPFLGYVMELLTGMEPIKQLAFVPQAEESPAKWYLGSGGLRRRLRLLAKAADVLSQLHGKGLVYSDPSPDNIFVSASVHAHQVRLIDADNLHYSSSPADRFVFTPGYGAPELISGRSGVNTLTDAHAFAVLTFHTLCLVHPLIGDAVEAGPPELEEEALSGRLPWIDAECDDANRTKAGIPRERVLSPRLKALFVRTFETGLIDPLARPGMAEWAERLAAAAELTIRCPDCDGTYYYTAPCCAWCDAKRPSFMTAEFNLWDPAISEDGDLVRRPDGTERKIVKVGGATFTPAEPLLVTAAMAGVGREASAGNAICEVRLDGKNILIRALADWPLRLVSVDAKQERPVSKTPTPVPLGKGRASWRLHLGPRESMHRALSFVHHGGQ